MRSIFINEWRLLLRSKVLLSIGLCFILTLIASVWISHKQVSLEKTAQDEAKQHLRAQWENIEEMNPHSAAHYGTYVFKTSSILSSLDNGVNNVTGRMIRVEGHVQNEMVHSEASQMVFVSKFGKLRASIFLQYIIPLLLVFLAFYSIYSEKQSGRLKLLLLQSNSLKRLLWTKTLSVCSVGLLLLAFVVLIFGILNVQSFDEEILKRLTLFIGAYLFYYFIVSGFTVYLTARFKNATLALTFMLGIWMFWTIFLPNVLMSSAEKLHPLPSRNKLATDMKEDRAKGIDGHNPTDERAIVLKEEVLAKYGVDSLSQLPINFDGIRMQADEDYGNQVWDKHFGGVITKLQLQKKSLQRGGIINPFISLQNLSMGFAASDNYHHQIFLEQVEYYRRKLIQSLNIEHAHGGSKTGDWGWKAKNSFFKGIPDFDYQLEKIKAVIRTYILDVACLLMWTVLIFGLLSFNSKKIEL